MITVKAEGLEAVMAKFNSYAKTAQDDIQALFLFENNDDLKKFSLKVELSNSEMDLIEKLVFGEDYKESKENKSRKKSKSKNH